MFYVYMFTNKINKEIRNIYKNNKLTCKEIGELYNVSDMLIWRIITNKTYKVK